MKTDKELYKIFEVVPESRLWGSYRRSLLRQRPIRNGRKREISERFPS